MCVFFMYYAFPASIAVGGIYIEFGHWFQLLMMANIYIDQNSSNSFALYLHIVYTDFVVYHVCGSCIGVEPYILYGVAIIEWFSPIATQTKCTNNC